MHAYPTAGRPSRLRALTPIVNGRAHRATLVPQGDHDDDNVVRFVPSVVPRYVDDDATEPPEALCAPPDLFGAWREATLRHKARAAARASLADEVQAALDVAALMGPLSRLEAGKVAGAVYRAHRAALDDAMIDVLRAMKSSRHREERALRDAVDAAAERVSALPDPFWALERDDILAEHDGMWIVVDRSAHGAKLLVAAKQPNPFPVVTSPHDPRPIVPVTVRDSDELLVDALARMAAHASDALRVVARGAKIESWINPPAAVRWRRLHVHVVAEPMPAGDVDWSRARSLLARRFR